MGGIGRRVGLALVLAAFSGAVFAQGAWVAPVSHEIRASDSGWQVSYLQISEQYTEYVSSGSSFPYGPVADSEQGTLRGGTLGYGDQWRHFGYGIVIADSEGNTDYNGYTQNTHTGTYTPLSAQTGNNRAQGRMWVNYGFAFDGLPNIAIVPGVVAGDEHWDRRTSDGDRETYNTYFAAGQLAFEHSMGPVVFSVSAAMGRILHPTMTSTLVNRTFVLGAKSWIAYRARLTCNVDRRISVYAAYAQVHYKWGRSAADNGIYEPASDTTLGQASAGVLIRVW